MRITHLSLTNFRSYGRLELNLLSGATVLHGANAQGKTNILEAIYYLATTRSPNADLDQQLINWEADRPEEPVVVGRLVAEVSSADGARQVEVRLIKETQRGQVSFRREALVNRRKVRLMDLLGNVRVVLFLPQDIQLITGSPSDRRRYMDITLCQTDPLYCRHLSAYNKVLEQRNALLRRLAEEGRGLDVLPIYTDKLVQLGSQIFARRAAFIADLGRETQRIHYEELTESRETIRLSYLPRMYPGSVRPGNNGAVEKVVSLADWLQAERENVDEIGERFHKALTAVQEQDIARASTTIGPHRDDWRFWVNGRELSSFGSRGQQRTAMLALKMGEISWIETQTGDKPILLLDEVMAELDEQRRIALLHSAQTAQQAILTATGLEHFTDGFLKHATTMTVANGRIQVDEARQIT